MASLYLTPKSANILPQIIVSSCEKPQIIQSQTLFKSIEILSKLEYQGSTKSKFHS